MNSEAQLSDWSSAVFSSTEELATTMLGLEGATLIKKIDNVEPNGNLAFISLVGEESAVQIGISATPENCQKLVKTLMGMEADEEDLEHDEVVDAYNEITNILAGMVKTEIKKIETSEINLGIPMFIQGELGLSENVQSSTLDVLIGDIPSSLIVIKKK